MLRQFEKRISALESHRSVQRISLDHVPDDALDEMERILSKPLLDLNAGDVEFFQQYGFLPSFSSGPGTLREWCTPEEISEISALEERWNKGARA